jgi:hypothetical protein
MYKMQSKVVLYLVSIVLLSIILIGCPPIPPVSQHETGLLVLTDEQYANLPITVPIGDLSTLPSSYDLSTDIPAPGNQGNQASCVAWAVGYGLKSYQERVERRWPLSDNSHLMSPAFIFNQIKIGDGKSGSYIEDAFNLLLTKGVCSLATMSYDDADSSKAPSAAAFTEALQYRISTWSRINQASIPEIKGYIANSGQPVVVAIKVLPDFDQLSQGNDVYDNDSGSNRGYHAILLTGYDDAKQAFKLLNSWGISWGLSGYGWVSYQLVPRVVTRAYVAFDLTDKTDSQAVAADKDALRIMYASGDSAQSVTQNLTLPTVGANGTTISWSSDNYSIVSSAGVVTRPVIATTVTLTATIAKGSAHDTKAFAVKVLEVSSVVYGITIDSYTISTTTPDPNQAVTLSNTGGQVHGGSTSDLIKVVIGFRDGSGNWVGGNPVVISSTVPGLNFQPWTGSGATITAPSISGTYYVWVRNAATVSNETAIQQFKDAHPTSADEERDDKLGTVIYVATYGVTITSCTISDTTPDAGQAVTLSGTSGQVHGKSTSDLIKVVIGFRDGSGNWVGGEPIVISSTVPGLSFQPWTGNSATITAPSIPGTYRVWVRNAATISDAVAIQQFEYATYTSADQQRNDIWGTAITVTTAFSINSMTLDMFVSGIQMRTGYHAIMALNLSPDGTKLYAGHWQSGSVSTVDPIGVYSTSSFSLLSQMPVGGCVGGVAVSSDGRYVFGTAYYNGTLSRFDTWNSNVKTTISLGSWAVQLWSNPDRTRLIADYNQPNCNPGTSHTLALVDISASNFSVLHTLSLGRSVSAGPAAFSQAGDYMYVACASNNSTGPSLLKLSVNSFTIADSLELTTGAGQTKLLSGVVRAGSTLYVGDRYNNKLYTVDETGFNKTSTINLQYSPWAIGIHPSGQYLFLLNGNDGIITALRLPDLSVAASLSGLNLSLIDIEFSTDGRTAYLANYDQPSGGYSVINLNP